MTNLIRDITDVNLPLELVAGNVFEQLKTRKPTYVGARQLKSPTCALASSYCRSISESLLITPTVAIATKPAAAPR